MLRRVKLIYENYIKGCLYYNILYTYYIMNKAEMKIINKLLLPATCDENQSCVDDRELVVRRESHSEFVGLSERGRGRDGS